MRVGKGRGKAIRGLGWLLLLWAGLCAAQGQSRPGDDYLLSGAPNAEHASQRACTPAMLARMDRHVEIPAPPAGWSGQPQSVGVFNIFAGEVMLRHGRREICGRMHDAHTRDPRFRASVGMVVVPEPGSHEPIRVAWSAPLKAGWVPSVHVGAPALLQRMDTARLLLRAACIAIAITLAFMALLDFFTTRDRTFLGYTLVCVLSVLGQAVVSGLSGYPQPWLPICGNEWRWLVAFSSIGLSLLAFCMWLLAGGSLQRPGWNRWLPLLAVAVCVIGSFAVWLPMPALSRFARELDVAFVLACMLVLVQGVLSLRRGNRDALAGVVVVLPFLALAAMGATRNMLLVEYRVEAIQVAITWFLTVSAYVFNLRLGVLRRQRDEMRALADTDALTGLPNRRAGLQRLERHVGHAKATGEALAVGFLDIDLFKRINDAHGHEAGDRVLVAVAQVLRGSVRQPADVIRMGGEEFLVLLPGVDVAAARERLENIRRNVTVAGQALAIPGLAVSVSIGLSALQAGDADVTPLLRRADAAMYRAKRDGRNRVVEAELALDRA